MMKNAAIARARTEPAADVSAAADVSVRVEASLVVDEFKVQVPLTMMSVTVVTDAFMSAMAASSTVKVKPEELPASSKITAADSAVTVLSAASAAATSSLGRVTPHWISSASCNLRRFADVSRRAALQATSTALSFTSPASFEPAVIMLSYMVLFGIMSLHRASVCRTRLNVICSLVAAAVGAGVAAVVSSAVGAAVGLALGAAVGLSVGAGAGVAGVITTAGSGAVVGALVGAAEGAEVGTAVGALVWAPDRATIAASSVTVKRSAIMPQG